MEKNNPQPRKKDSVELKDDRLYYTEDERDINFYITNKYNPNIFVGSYKKTKGYFYPKGGIIKLDELEKMLNIIKKNA